MDFLERLRVVGASFVIFDLDVDNAALPPLSGDPNDVQDIGNARPVGGFTRKACEHVRRTLMHDVKHIGAGDGTRHGSGALPYSKTLPIIEAWDMRAPTRQPSERLEHALTDTS